MSYVFEIEDKTKRRIYLTHEIYKHILRHLNQYDLEEIKIILKNPLLILGYSFDSNVRHYYKYYKNRKSKAKYLRVVVKYLNGKGFIITAHYLDKIK